MQFLCYVRPVCMTITAFNILPLSGQYWFLCSAGSVPDSVPKFKGGLKADSSNLCEERYSIISGHFPFFFVSVDLESCQQRKEHFVFSPLTVKTSLQR